MLIMLITDKSQLKGNTEQMGFQIVLKTSKSLSWSNRLRQTVPYNHNYMAFNALTHWVTGMAYILTMAYLVIITMCQEVCTIVTGV